MDLPEHGIGEGRKEIGERWKKGEKFRREINKWKIIRMNVTGWRETNVAEIMLIKFSSNSSERIEINERSETEKANRTRTKFAPFFSLNRFAHSFSSSFGWRDAYTKFIGTSFNEPERQWWTVTAQYWISTWPESTFSTRPNAWHAFSNLFWMAVHVHLTECVYMTVTSIWPNGNVFDLPQFPFICNAK